MEKYFLQGFMEEYDVRAFTSYCTWLHVRTSITVPMSTRLIPFSFLVFNSSFEMINVDFGDLESHKFKLF